MVYRLTSLTIMYLVVLFLFGNLCAMYMSAMMTMQMTLSFSILIQFLANSLADSRELVSCMPWLLIALALEYCSLSFSNFFLLKSIFFNYIVIVLFIPFWLFHSPFRVIISGQ